MTTLPSAVLFRQQAAQFVMTKIVESAISWMVSSTIYGTGTGSSSHLGFRRLCSGCRGLDCKPQQSRLVILGKEAEMSKADHIIAIASKNPCLTLAQVGRAVGVSGEYVRLVANKHDL